MITSNYFQLSNSLIGEIYFRVSKHLGWRPSEVVKHKYENDIKFLIIKYASIIREEQEEIRKTNEEMRKIK